MTNPNIIAEALWATSKDRPIYKSWSEVPQNVKDIWRVSYDNFSEALTRAGYIIVPVMPSEATLKQMQRNISVAPSGMEARAALQPSDSIGKSLSDKGGES